MRLFGLIGYPLSHSFSKKYFDGKFDAEGLTDCRFENFPLPSIHELKELLVEQQLHLQGLAVTIPYKQMVLRFLDDQSKIPEGLKSCNCIKIEGGKLIGYNTDYIGFEKSLRSLLKPHHKRALILGNGGAAAAVAYALERMQIDNDIVSRKIHERSTYVYEDLTQKIMSENTLIINTTPLGMYPDVDSFPPIPYAYLSKEHLLYDLVYNPLKSVFLQKGEQQGAVIKNGADMLVLQAEENWKIWNS